MPSNPPRHRLKILIAGGFAAGKTSFVGSISEITPLTTEAELTAQSLPVDDISLTQDKTTTTVALDFGRRTIDDDVVLYLFGTPGQDRFWFMWEDLIRGAVGAVVIADTRRIDACFPAISYFEERQLPFIVAINHFPQSPAYHHDEVRESLDLTDQVPVVDLNARNTDSCRQALIALVDYRIGEQE
ncbi:GTP-binding protein [Streptomyces sp. NPDC003860]